MIRRTVLLGACLLACVGSASAQSIELAGVKYEPSLQLPAGPVVLNGAGIRYKAAVFKVYTAGLYLGRKAQTPDAVINEPGPKRMRIVMLREVDANEFGKLFVRGIEKNSTREQFAKSIPGTIYMGGLFAAKKRLTPGEYFTVDWVPGTGTVISVNGKQEGQPIKEPEFFGALMRIWLGPSPADDQLKDALLGKAAPKRDIFAN